MEISPFVLGLPKVELHVHIEGTLEPELKFELAQRNGIKLPFDTPEQVRASYKFDDLTSFLDAYYDGMSVLQTAEDFYALAMAYFRKVAPQNLRYAEIFFDPQAHTSRGVPFNTVITGLRRAQIEAEQQLGITSALIMCFLRDFQPEYAMATLLESLPYRRWILGVGLDSDENGNPPSKFASVFARAKAEGYLLTMHCDVDIPGSMSLGPGHNPTESVVEMLEGTGYTTKIDMARVYKVRDHFKKIRPKYAEFESKTLVDTKIFDSQIPGGMLSNMESQLRAQGAADRTDEVMAMVPICRKDAGYPPLVTPSSQIVGTQAVFNVLMGEYKVMTGEFADMMLGYYGASPAPRNPEVIALAAEQAKKEPITVRPADLLAPEWDSLVEQASALPGYDGTEEDVLTFALFPGVAPTFFEHRNEGPKSVARTEAQMKAAAEGQANALSGPITYNVTVNGASHTVSVEPA